MNASSPPDSTVRVDDRKAVEPAPTGVWKNTSFDCVLFALSAAQPVATLWLAARWDESAGGIRALFFALLVFMTVYNVIVVSHVFTHQPWFRSQAMNRVASMINSVNIGQSLQVYRFMHVRNHHVYGNDRRGPDDATKDVSSTFRKGRHGCHQNLIAYALSGAIATTRDSTRALFQIKDACRVGEGEAVLRALASRESQHRAIELRQVQLDRLAMVFAVIVFVGVSWRWTTECLAPALFIAFAVVNVQNYYEHYGARPEEPWANSVSFYGRLYNRLTFNDGYHQEHHLQPGVHWRGLPAVRAELAHRLDDADRLTSPVPAVIGFLHRDRIGTS
jgi:fatty acid desaturase